jgi:hypothetical protein
MALALPVKVLVGGLLILHGQGYICFSVGLQDGNLGDSVLFCARLLVVNDSVRVHFLVDCRVGFGRWLALLDAGIRGLLFMDCFAF